MTRYETAVSELEALGVKFGASGDVEELRAAIDRSDVRRRQRPKVFGARNQCERKRRYETRDAALKRAKVIGNPEVRPYRCVWCGGWHNGNPPKG